jgi:hypothetical protein
MAAKTVQEEVDEYIRDHPYLQVATNAQERLILWLSRQPERNVIARFMAESDDEHDRYVRNQTLDSVLERMRHTDSYRLDEHGLDIERVINELRK